MTDVRNSDSNNSFDLVVVGAGPVGIQAALTAARPPFSKNVCIVDAPRFTGVLMDERENKDLSIGGPTGLFSKALRDTSKRIGVNMLREMGLREDSVWNEIVNACIDLATANADDVFRQLDLAGVTYMEGFAEFQNDSDALLRITKSDGTSFNLNGEQILLATGSKAFRPSNIPFDGKRIFDSDSINSLDRLPRKVAITGSGIIAVEYAKIFRNLGADVTLLIRDNVPRNALMKIGLDKDVASALLADIVRSGINIERGAQLKSITAPENPLSPMTIELEAKGGGVRPAGTATEVKCDCYLAAVGRQANTAKLNLDAAGIETDEYGCISVNNKLQTSNPKVFAAGDVLGRPFLASTGIAQGVAAVDFMFTENEPFQCDPEDGSCIESNLGTAGANFDPTSLASNPFSFPVGIWSSPEASYFGLSAQQAKENGIDVGEGIALYSECLRGVMFSPNGLLKLVFDKSDNAIIGVHIVGDDACELIHYGMELVRSRCTLQNVTSQMYTAVTFHELYRIAAAAGLDEAAARKRRAAAGQALTALNRRKRFTSW
eukprot:CAMPEP_0196820548 /NCGR_PEP_ID=MMETSP1362-20130617/75818_1 /TAXON_ID=163516 /ORGANISM="Leptocylindrus danicus, Strain CCMP1856" /LENGTH=547 /DNA_ID=CAMNT_0042199479 /DNA_START=196 /DNA_END=1839 /DNA_ORIENTATION=-